MPQNKNALLRYRILDRCFSNRYNRYTFDELLDYLNDELCRQEGLYSISTRQLREDIKTMRDIYKAPIVAKSFDGHKCYYAYDEDGFSIFKSGITDEDYKALQETLEMLGKYKGSNMWLGDVIANLECRFDIVPNTEKLVFFDENSDLKGVEFLGDIIRHTINHEAIDVVYRSFRGHEEEYYFNPYCVKQYNGRWFMLGYEAKYGRINNFALDRIVSFKKSDREFVVNTLFDVEDYFRDIIGVTVPGEEDSEILDVRLKFDSVRFPYVVSKPLHHSQRVIDKENCVIEIRVKKNKELKQRIFSYMPQVEVLSPLSLRMEIMKDIKDNLEKYCSAE